MRRTMSKLAAILKILLKEEGQDLVEYALVVCLVAFAAAASMRTMANSINAFFAVVGNTMTSAS